MPNPPAEATDERFRSEDWYAADLIGAVMLAELHGAEVDAV